MTLTNVQHWDMPDQVIACRCGHGRAWHPRLLAGQCVTCECDEYEHEPLRYLNMHDTWPTTVEQNDVDNWYAERVIAGTAGLPGTINEARALIGLPPMDVE